MFLVASDVEIHAQGQFGLANQVITLHSDTYQFLKLHMYGEYALFNVEFTCLSNDYWLEYTPVYLYCDENDANQFFTFDSSCTRGEFTLLNANCIIHESIDTIDNQTLIMFEIVIDLVNQFKTAYDIECNNDDTMILYIGYPLYATDSIINNNFGSPICCRGAESCAYSRDIYSNLGNIFCTGDFSVVHQNTYGLIMEKHPHYCR